MFPLSASFASLLCSLVTVTAAPGQYVERAELLGRQDASVAVDSAWDNIKLFEQFCAATYCAPNYSGWEVSKLRCHLWYNNGTSCPLVEAADTTVIAKFDNTGPTGMTGYVAQDHTRKLTVVAFRGTQNLRNYWADFAIRLVDTDLCDNCTAQEGFWTSWNTSRPLVLPAVRYATEMRPDYDIAVVGHSLGGSQATLCAADLRNQGYKVALYAYGNPRVCGPRLANYISAQPGGNHRVTHLNDPVPMMAPTWAGYQHIEPEYFIDSATNATNATAKNLIGPLFGIDNPLGNSGQPMFPWSFAPHEWYIGNTTSCVTNTIGF